MMKENAREFATGIAAYAYDGCVGSGFGGESGRLFGGYGCCVSQGILPIGF